MKKLVIWLLSSLMITGGGATLAMIGCVRNSALAEGAPKVLINELLMLWGAMVTAIGLVCVVVFAVMVLVRIEQE